jgi:hypothetical protein
VRFSTVGIGVVLSTRCPRTLYNWAALDTRRFGKTVEFIRKTEQERTGRHQTELPEWTPPFRTNLSPMTKIGTNVTMFDVR